MQLSLSVCVLRSMDSIIRGVGVAPTLKAHGGYVYNTDDTKTWSGLR